MDTPAELPWMTKADKKKANKWLKKTYGEKALFRAHLNNGRFIWVSSTVIVTFKISKLRNPDDSMFLNIFKFKIALNNHHPLSTLLTPCNSSSFCFLSPNLHLLFCLPSPQKIQRIFCIGNIFALE